MDDFLSWRGRSRETVVEKHHTEKMVIDPAVAEAIGTIAEQLRHLTQKVWEIEQHMATLAPMRHEHDVAAHIVDGQIIIGPPRAVA